MSTFSRFPRLLCGITLAALATGLVNTPEALARAGGGRHHGVGMVYLLLLPFLILYAWYVNRRINQKKEQTDALVDKLSEKDAVLG